MNSLGIAKTVVIDGEQIDIKIDENLISKNTTVSELSEQLENIEKENEYKELLIKRIELLKGEIVEELARGEELDLKISQLLQGDKHVK